MNFKAGTYASDTHGKNNYTLLDVKGTITSLIDSGFLNSNILEV